MKSTTFKPGFELIFSIALIAIIGLHPVLLAQSQQDMDIRIINGDTTINGQNIKQLSVKNRQAALKNISHISSDKSILNDTGASKFRKIEIRKRSINGGGQTMSGTMIYKDTLSKLSQLEPCKFRGSPAKTMAFNYRMNNRMDRGDRTDTHLNERRNTQNFAYINTDKEGISRHVRFHVSEASNDDLKKIPYVEGAKFELSDLNLVPEFSSGKTLLTFNLSSKKLADVKMTDSEGNLIWSERSTSGSFSKRFTIGLNGIYYLQIKHGNAVMVKRIVK